MKIIQNEEALYKYHSQFNSFNISLSALKEAINVVDPSILIKKAIDIKNNNEIVVKDVNDVKYFFNLQEYETFHIFGAGKATARMAKSLMETLNLEFSSGAITIPYNEKVIPDKLIVIEAGHPIPDQNSINGTKTMIDLLKKIQTKSLVFVLISGGASSLMCQPLDNVQLKSKQAITKLLLKSGASIHEINTVRKHLSKIKGGQLPKYLDQKGHVITLILSDVIGDDLTVIGSGPTVGDNSTFTNAIEILKKYNIWNIDDKNALDILNIKKVLQDGKRGILEETPRVEDKIYKRVSNIIIGNNEIACKRAMNELLKFGIKTKYLGSNFNSEAKVFGKELADLLISSHLRSLNNINFSNESFAYVLGGETVVNLNLNDNYKNREIGTGGRNQESIVSSINYLQSCKRLEDFTIICCGTDGIDGNSNAAGGLVSPLTLNTIDRKKIDINSYLNSHDSGTLLKKIRSQIITGRTGTNVNDIAIICNVKK
jgi:hydroxypyruvate reductase/glycerate 2-kinase